MTAALDDAVRAAGTRGAAGDLSVAPLAADALRSEEARWEAISPDAFSGPLWFDVWRRHFDATGQWSPCVLRRGATLAGVFPWVLGDDRRFGLRFRVASLANCIYTPVTRPALAPGVDVNAAVEAALEQLLAQRWDLLRLAHVPEEDGTAAAFRQAFGRLGVAYREAAGSPNWYQEVRGSADEFLNALHKFSPAYIRRRARKLERAGNVRLYISTGGPELDADLDAYYAVYAASWKKPEPFPTFHRELARAAAQAGWLRLGVCRLDEKPVAAQLWLVRAGKAYIVKLAYDEAYREISPGVVLTAALVRHVLDVDGVHELDYLKGDESYKRDWLSQRRVRRKFVAYHPRSLRGRAAAAVGALLDRTRPAPRGRPE